MRWLTFVLCAVIGIILQTTLASRLAVFHVKPDWMFVLTVFFALYSTRRDAVLAGWILGLLVDLTSVERLGLMSAAFALTAMLVNAVRHLVFLKNSLTHFMVTVGAGLVLHAALSAYHVGVYAPGPGAWRAVLLERGMHVIYTGLWALPVHHCLLKCTRWLQLDTSSYGHAGLVPVDVHHV